MTRHAMFDLEAAHVTDKTLHELLMHTLKLAGCGACGRISRLRIDFLGDPTDEIRRIGLDKLGVLSQEIAGFHGK